MSYRIFGDWGTSRLRLYRVEGERVTDRLEGNGIGQLRSPPDAVLRVILAPWRTAGDPEAIMLAGMVGSRNGWREVDYVDCPAGWREWANGSARLSLDDIPVCIAPGLSCAGPLRHDVMRGEETQIFGALSMQPDLAKGKHQIVLPGTHSKWANTDDGRITAFTTFLTGELFALLREHSTLLRAAPNGAVDVGDDSEGFVEGLERAASHTSLLSALFEVRTSQLLGGRSRGWARNFLSGLLIGSEVKAFADPAERDDPIYLIGAPDLSARYANALERLGRTAIGLDAESSVIRGLSLLEHLS